jgi:hypothetical protein
MGRRFSSALPPELEKTGHRSGEENSGFAGVLALLDFFEQLLGLFLMLSVVGELYRQLAD